MIERFERTGEFRVPAYGETIDDNGPCEWRGDGEKEHWILRRIDAPAPKEELTEEYVASLTRNCPKCDGVLAFGGNYPWQCPRCGTLFPALPAPGRPGTEEVLAYLKKIPDVHESARLVEALRRVRVHEHLRESGWH